MYGSIYRSDILSNNKAVLTGTALLFTPGEQPKHSLIKAIKRGNYGGISTESMFSIIHTANFVTEKNQINMKRIIVALLALGLSAPSFAQGIAFETGTWKEVVAKAKKEKRLVYVDVYTTWCGPCKMMAKEIFPQKEAGDKYNTHFINYKIDAEKGEGIAFAEKYKVNGYPTNLYIDPNNEEPVYLAMGGTDQISEFNHRADMALEAAKDPMTWSTYETQFGKGKQDKAFLEAYIRKAQVLNKNNDAALSKYVKQYVTGTPDDQTLNFLLDHTRTLDNGAFPVLEANKSRINALHKEIPDYFATWGNDITGTTVMKAIDARDEQILNRAVAFTRKNSKTGALDAISYQKAFYKKTGMEDKLKQVTGEEVRYLTTKSDEDYARDDKATLEDMKAMMRLQMKAEHVPEAQIETVIAKNLENPEYQKMASVRAAQSLNELAWNVYEQQRQDKSQVQQALTWIEKATRMTKGMNRVWPAMADTYAHLLFVNGDKEKAIAMQEEAVAAARAGGDENSAQELAKGLEQIKNGKLE